MAKTYLTNINLKGNQLLNAAIQPSASAPSALTAGQLYYNTADGIFYFSTGSGTGSWQPVGVQYIKSVGSNLSVDGSGALSISSDPSFNTIHLTQDGQGENILVGNDAYIGDINISNFIGIKGYEDATKGGIKFGNAKTESIFTDGSNLTLNANNDIVLLPGSNYAYIGTPLIDGSNRIATLGDINTDLTGYVTESGTQNLSNKTFLGNVYFQSGGGAGGTNNWITVDNNNGTLQIHSGYALEITAAVDVNINSNGGDIILNPDGNAYIGGTSANQRIATINDLTNAENYADTAANNALNSANSYTDAAISSEISRANSAYDVLGSASNAQTAAQNYADTAATNAQTAAQNYADTAATNAENAAKSYADSLATNYDAAGSATTAENNAKSYADTKIADLVGMAPTLLDTLEKIDAAIANDANFSTTLLNDIASAQATAEGYTDTAIASEVTNRNSAIATAKSEAITSANNYTDSQLSSFGNQTATDITNAITTAENYADSLVTSLSLTSKYVGTINGDGSTDTFTINHNLGKRSVMVQVYQSSGSPDTQWADVEVDMTRISINAITIGMGVPPTNGTSYEVVIVG